MSNFIAIGNSEPTPDNLPDEIKKIINDGKREAGFNPDGTPIMSHTDTNQASEDKLVDEVADILNNNLHASCECHECVITWNDSDAISLVTELIRTEKLKLLAEVRKRVVGESDYQPGNQAPDLVEHNRLVRDGLRFEQRIELTKLEAEL